MANYYSPTFLLQAIPLADLQPIERLLLRGFFDEHECPCESSENAPMSLMYSADAGPETYLEFDAEDIKTAVATSPLMTRRLKSWIEEYLSDGSVDSSTTPGSEPPWVAIFQDIIGRSVTIRFLVVQGSFACDRPRPDGFGGFAKVITASDCHSFCTNSFISGKLAELGLLDEDVFVSEAAIGRRC